MSFSLSLSVLNALSISIESDSFNKNLSATGESSFTNTSNRLLSSPSTKGASTFISSAKASESWLISPSIDLSSATAPNLTFEHTGKYFTSNKLTTEQTLWVSTNYTEGAPSTATWTQLTIPTWPSGSDWTFVSSGAIDLSAYTANSNVRLAFKYASTTAGAATWELKNLVVKE